VKKIISLILVGILSLPSVFGLNHVLFEKHAVCVEQNSHFHEAEIHCSTCDFIRLNIEFNSEDYSNSFGEYLTYLNKKTSYNQIISSNFFVYFDSRGPPFDC